MGVILGLDLLQKENSNLDCSNIEDRNPSSRNFGSIKLNYKYSQMSSGDIHFFWSFTFTESGNEENPSSRDFGQIKQEKSGEVHWIQVNY